MTLLELDHTFADRLDDFGAPWSPRPVPAAELIRLNSALAHELGLDPAALASEPAVAVLAGAAAPDGAVPIAQVYAGHQFGGFNPQLGDGRAVLLGEVVDPEGRRFDVSLKGSGRTPFSRGGDGKAALGPVLREYLMGEAMHSLGVPTTRALAAVTTGELVRREGMLPGAVLTRVAASHLRVGTFQFFAARGDVDRLRRLLDYTIDRHDPDLADADGPGRALGLLGRVVERQAELIAHWMSLGFIHGVMNTDNVTISGETIDYGPCAFMDAFDPSTVFSSIDHGGRYAYGNQPTIGLWNMARLAEALLPVLDDDPDRAVERATERLDRFMPTYEAAWLDRMRGKLGLDGTDEGDRELATDFLDLLQRHRIDMTTAFRRLIDAAEGDRDALTGLFDAPIDEWVVRWRARLAPGAAERMRLVNPVYVPRNHLVEEALGAAVNDGEFDPFDELLDVVTSPYDEQVGRDRYAEPAPDRFTAGYRTFCGT
ncbi:MAG: YdiU family protein [Ilumatobacter sp.]|nr:YdiU family protein [Ilumatobacter sp.]